MNLRRQSALTISRRLSSATAPVETGVSLIPERQPRFTPAMLNPSVREPSLREMPAQHVMVEPQVNTFQHIRVAGTPYECGFQYGQQAAPHIRENIEIYSQLFYFHAQLDKASALQLALSYIPAIETFDAELLEEMKGVADGAGVSLPEIVMLNTRTELLSSVPLLECTSMAVLPPATQKGQVWLAQNWDWYQVTIDNVLLYTVKQFNRPSVTMLVEAGQIGKMGMNDAGLGLCLNWLETHHRRVGVPVVVLCRAILKTGYPAEAIDAVYNAKRASAVNLMIAHKSGFAVNLECTPDEIDFLEPDHGIIVHSNHFVSPRLRSFDHGVKDIAGSSIVRRQRGIALLNSEHGQIDANVIKQVQRDNACGSASICVMPCLDEDQFAQWGTLAGIVMDLTRMEMFIAKGRPNESEYVRVVQ